MVAHERQTGRIAAAPRRPAEAPQPTVAPPHVAGVLDLQRGAGNRATALRLQRPAGGRACGPGCRCAGCTAWRAAEVPDRGAPDTLEREAHATAARIAPGARGGPHRGPEVDAGLRHEVRDQLGVDVSGVRIRSDHRAGLAALARGAEAFTVGPEIFLAPQTGRSPSDGATVVAHELAHAAQQSLGRAPVAPQDQAMSAADRAQRIAELEQRVTDPAVGPAELKQLNEERNALLHGRQPQASTAPPVSSQASPAAATPGGAAPAPAPVPVGVEYEAYPIATTGLSSLGLSMSAVANPLPGTQALGEADVFTRFAGESPWNLNPELRPRLWQTPTSTAEAMDRFAPFERAGLSKNDLFRMSERLERGGVASLSAEELHVLRTIARVHAVEGGTAGSPLLSLSELVPKEALEGLPKVATERLYVVRVRIDPADVIRVNEVLGKAGRTSKNLAELEVLVAQDLRGPGPQILSITANPAGPLGGLAGSALKWGGHAMVVIGAAITIAEVVTASGSHRRETQGRAFGSFAGATALGAFGVGLCVGLGIATGGIVIALCGIGAGLLGGLGGGFAGGRVGRAFD